jgi:HAE1 family hydrophobic/amphiphilic exporter-1
MPIVQYAIRYPITTTVGVLLVVLFGVVSLLRLPVQLTPDVTKQEITVDTRWEGASPHEVEREIVEEQEEQLKGVEGLEKMFSSSSYGSAKIILRFPAGTNVDSSLLRVSNRLNQVRQYPSEVDEPVISSADTAGSAIGWFIFQASDDNPVDIDTMRDFAEDVIKSRFERVPGVAASNVYGGREREVQVLVDPAKLAARSLTIMDLAEALDEENRDYSAGDFDEGKRTYVVRTVGEYKSPEQIENVIVARRNGAPVYVRDLASVRLTYKDPLHVVRQRGAPCIAVNAVRETGANVLEIMSMSSCCTLVGLPCFRSTMRPTTFIARFRWCSKTSLSEVSWRLPCSISSFARAVRPWSLVWPFRSALWELLSPFGFWGEISMSSAWQE